MRWIGIVLCALLGPRSAAAEGSGGSGGFGPGSWEADYDGSEVFVFVPESYRDGGAPVPLVMFLHGDEGDPRTAILWNVPPIWQERQDAILLIPRAPYAGGSWWQDNERHDVWLTGLVDSVLSQYNVDLDRITAGGSSGGATHLAYHAFKDQERYAAVHMMSGGYWWGIDDAPPDCPISVRFMEGSNDFLYGNAQDVHDRLAGDGHGHPLDWYEIPGEDHTVGDLANWENMYIWLATQVHGCADGGGDADSDADSDGDADSDADIDADDGSDGIVWDEDDDAEDDGGDGYAGAGCGCAATGGRPVGLALWALLCLAPRRRVNRG